MKQLNSCNTIAAQITNLIARARDWRNADPVQARALRRIGSFFLLMLIFTLIARGTAGATMPIVTTATAIMDTIEQSIQTSGTIAPTSFETISSPENLMVQDVLISQGEQIKAGDAVVKFYANMVDKEIERQKAKLSELNKKLSLLRKNENVDPSAVENSQQELAMAQEDYFSSIDEYNEALSQIDKQKSRVSKLEDAYSSLQSDESADPAAVAQALSDLSVAQAELESLRTEKETLTKSIQQAQRNVEKAQLSAEQAERSYNQAAEDARYTENTNSAEAGNVKLDIADVQERIKELTAIQSNDYQLFAEQGGIVQSVSISSGSETQRVVCTLEDTTKGYLFSFALTKEQAEKVSYGTKVTVTRGSEEEDCVVSGISGIDAAGNITVSARLNKKEWKAGPAEIKIVLSRIKYNYTLPISAVHTDNTGSFVYIVEEHNTTLGLNNVLARIPVKIEETDETKVAVSGALTTEDKVVSTSTKPLTKGCKVRVDS